MVSTLQDLIAPFSEPEFAEMLRTRSLVFRRGSDQKKFERLLDWDTFLSVIENDVPIDKLRVTRDGKPVLRHMYLEGDKVNTKNLAMLLHRGASVIVVPFDPYVPKLEALCSDVTARLSEKTYAGVVATTGPGCAFTLHYDPQDIIILQIAGSKRWKVYDCPVVCPVGGMREQALPQNGPAFDEVLRPGDFLFLPAGHWHHCENGPDRSLHLGILIEPPTGWHAVRALHRKVLAEEMFRRPLTRLGGPAETAAYEALLRRRLIERIEQMSFSHVVDEDEKTRAPNGGRSNPQ